MRCLGESNLLLRADFHDTTHEIDLIRLTGRTPETGLGRDAHRQRNAGASPHFSILPSTPGQGLQAAHMADNSRATRGGQMTRYRQDIASSLPRIRARMLFFALISGRRQMPAKTKNQKGETSMKSAWLLVGLTSAALATSAWAQEMDFAKVEIITQQLGPNLYMLTGSGGLDPSHDGRGRRQDRRARGTRRCPDDRFAVRCSSPTRSWRRFDASAAGPSAPSSTPTFIATTRRAMRSLQSRAP